jgi:membrane protein DedA with SNARE-associated domain
MDATLDFLASLPPGLTYLVLGAGAALENFVPPVPADTFILLGGFLAVRGSADVVLVFLVTWLANTSGALLVYGAGHRFGPPFFDTRFGRLLLQPEQLARLRRFYRRRGTPAIFLARFLPGLRAVVPAFAGVARLSFPSVAVPVTVASAIWYGGLVWLGSVAGENLETIVEWYATANRLLLIIAILIAAVVLAAWLRTRRSAADSAK